MTTIQSKFSTLTLNTTDIFSEIKKNELSRRKEAAKVAARNMRKNANSKSESSPGGYPAKLSGEIHKSIGWAVPKDEDVAYVGSKSFKIHLIEFGHGDGKEKNKRPLITPSLLESEDEIIGIMSRKYW